MCPVRYPVWLCGLISSQIYCGAGGSSFHTYCGFSRVLCGLFGLKLVFMRISRFGSFRSVFASRSLLVATNSASDFPMFRVKFGHNLILFVKHFSSSSVGGAPLCSRGCLGSVNARPRSISPASACYRSRNAACSLGTYGPRVP